MTSKEFCDTYAVERKGTNSRKWDGLADKFGEADLLSFWIADMDFRCADSIIEALHKRVEHGAFGYTFPGNEYFDAVLGWQKERFGTEIKKEWVRFSTGIMAAIYWLLHEFTQEGESALIFTPVYYPFHEAVVDTGRRLVSCELINTDGYYRIDYDAFEKQVVEDKVKIIIFCSPHNPICRVWREEELRKFFEICEKHDILVISDEVHQDMVFGDNKQISSIALDGGKYADRIITAISASKTFNLPALPNSHIIISNDELRSRYDKYTKSVDRAETNCLSLEATRAGYEGGAQWLDGVLKVIYENYETARDMLKEHAPKAVVTPLEGTYLMWIDLRGHIKAEEVSDFALKTCRLAVDYGEWFSSEATGFIRVNLATKPENIIEAMNRIIEGIRKQK